MGEVGIIAEGFWGVVWVSLSLAVGLFWFCSGTGVDCCVLREWVCEHASCEESYKTVAVHLE